MSRYGDKHENQFTKGTRTGHTLESRLQESATKALTRLDRIIADDDSENLGAQVAASKIILDKVAPNLSSIEASVRNETEHADEAQLVARLQALIENNPELAQKLLPVKLIKVA